MYFYKRFQQLHLTKDILKYHPKRNITLGKHKAYEKLCWFSPFFIPFLIKPTPKFIMIVRLHNLKAPLTSTNLHHEGLIFCFTFFHTEEEEQQV